MTANFPDDFKTDRIFPDADGIPPMLLILFRGEGVPKIPLKKLLKEKGSFGPKTPFSYISALFGQFLTLFDATNHCW